MGSIYSYIQVSLLVAIEIAKLASDRIEAYELPGGMLVVVSNDSPEVVIASASQWRWRPEIVN